MLAARHVALFFSSHIKGPRLNVSLISHARKEKKGYYEVCTNQVIMSDIVYTYVPT